MSNNGNNGGNKGRGRKPNGGGGGGKKRKRTRGVPGVTQNVSLSVNNAFGDAAKPQTIVKGLDAFDPTHVPLPRAVGDYTVIRTTEVVPTSDRFSLFGPMRSSIVGDHTGESWSKVCSIHNVGNSNNAINTASGAYRNVFTAMGSGAWSDAKVTPAAFTVHIMNPEALQTTSGIVYIGRAKQLLNPGGSTRSWEQLAQDLVSYSNPELCAAGKLALRGVKVDTVPYDMNALADFRPLDDATETAFTWSDNILRSDGFAPIFIYNPNNVPLQVLVCCEWRVRFDPSNPAYASHTYHRPSTLGYWDRLQRIGSALGNGVMDIAEKNAARMIMNAAGSAVRKAPLMLL